MKYIMILTEDDAQIPILFPECLTHSNVAAHMERAVSREQKTGCVTVSAGFVSFDGLSVDAHGESESLGLKSKPSDGKRIALGDSSRHLPDAMVDQVYERLKRAKLD